MYLSGVKFVLEPDADVTAWLPTDIVASKRERQEGDSLMLFAQLTF
jgi:hypothetical protein